MSNKIRNASGNLIPKTLTQLRCAGDIWTCPGCGADNLHSHHYVEQVLHGRGLKTLLEKNRATSIDDLPSVGAASSFETQCGACRNSYATKRLGGRRNPILHSAYTHEED